MTPPLTTVLKALERRYGALTPPSHDPFQLIVWDKVAYLATDERRAAAFEDLRSTIGVTPKAILAAKRAAVVAALELGGINAAERATNLIAAAEMVVGELDGTSTPHARVHCATP